MSTARLRPFGAGNDGDDWDAFVGRSCNGTLLHTRRFLSYHRDRFRDRSLVIEDGKGKTIGVLPLAEDPGGPAVVVSHPGITYGGVVQDGSLRGEEMVEVLADLCEEARGWGATLLRYKAVPAIFQQVPVEDDLWALFRMQARRSHCGLDAVVDLGRRLPAPPMRSRRHRHAIRAGVEVVWGWESADRFWPLLEETLGERFGIAPVHSLEEITELAGRFPGDIHLAVARIEAEVVAGCVFFAAGPSFHLQYNATSEVGRKSSAMDCLVEAALQKSGTEGFRYFSFGVSTEDDGRRLNENLYDFKVSFGAGSVVFEHFELDL